MTYSSTSSGPLVDDLGRVAANRKTLVSACIVIEAWYMRDRGPRNERNPMSLWRVAIHFVIVRTSRGYG